MLGVSILSLFMIFLLDFGTLPTVWYFYFFILFLRFFYWRLELFRQCGIFCFSFYSGRMVFLYFIIYITTSRWEGCGLGAPRQLETEPPQGLSFPQNVRVQWTFTKTHIGTSLNSLGWFLAYLSVLPYH